MFLTRVSASWVVSVLLCGSAVAQEQLLTLVSTMEGGVQELRFVTKDGMAPHAGSAPLPEITTPGLVWEHTDGGAQWMPWGVSIGDRGYQVFTGQNSAFGAQPAVPAELLSCFDVNPPTPVWADAGVTGDAGNFVASADETDGKVMMTGAFTGGPPPYNFRPVLRKYSSTSSTPDWFHIFPMATNGGWYRVAISRDGQTIVAAVSEPQSTAYTFNIAVFTASSSTPVSYTKFTGPKYQGLKGFDLSADGSTLYYNTINEQDVHIFDVASHTDVFQTHIASGFNQSGISGDGSVFACASMSPAAKWAVFVWEKQGGTYVNTFIQEPNLPGKFCPHAIDVSDDGLTIASGWTNINTYQADHVEALDVPTKTVTMSATQHSNSPALQDVVNEISVSADGSYFAVASWGDGPGPIAECRIFSRNSDTPVASLNVPGSGWACDMSADGARAVFGSSLGHLSSTFNGGVVHLLTTGNEDLVLHGTPHVGAMVSLDLDLPAGANGFLLVSLAELTPPHVFAAAGTLYIDPALLLMVPLGIVPPGGTTTVGLQIPDDPLLIGVAPLFQGFAGPPKHLSSDWIRMTILP